MRRLAAVNDGRLKGTGTGKDVEEGEVFAVSEVIKKLSKKEVVNKVYLRKLALSTDVSVDVRGVEGSLNVDIAVEEEDHVAPSEKKDDEEKKTEKISA